MRTSIFMPTTPTRAARSRPPAAAPARACWRAAARWPFVIDQQQRVVVLAEGGRADVAHQQRHALARALGLGVGQQVSLSAAKPTQYSSPACARAVRHLGQDVGVLDEVQRGTTPEPSFLIFCSACVAGRQSATAAVAMKILAPALLHRGASRADCTSTRARRAAWAGHRAGHQRDLAPASRAARAMAKPILPLERLVMPRTGSMASKVGRRDQHLLARQRLGRKKAISSSSSSSASSMRPSPVSPQAWSPLATPSTWRRRLHLRHVALRGRVRPHLAVHGRRQQQRHALDGPRQAQQAQQLVGPPLRQRAMKSALPARSGWHRPRG
jgi:hypothetical protein